MVNGGNKLAMSKINGISPKFYSALYLCAISLVGVYCALNAIYNVMIGGSPFYFFAVLVLFLQSIFALRDSEQSRNLAGFGLILLVIGLIYAYGFTFLTHLKTVVLVPSILLTLFGLPTIYKDSHKLNFLKIALLISLIGLAAIQYYELSMLKEYYDSLPQTP